MKYCTHIPVTKYQTLEEKRFEKIMGVVLACVIGVGLAAFLFIQLSK